MDIAARALLVNTTVRVWTGEKRDRAITREICTMKGAEANAVRANKSLLGEHIHGVQTAERAVRQTVHEPTQPTFGGAPAWCRSTNQCPSRSFSSITLSMRSSPPIRISSTKGAAGSA